MSRNHFNSACSSGMCKAGFAGDDAPRAVFRRYSLDLELAQRVSSLGSRKLIYARSFNCWTTSSSWVREDLHLASLSADTNNPVVS